MKTQSNKLAKSKTYLCKAFYKLCTNKTIRAQLLFIKSYNVHSTHIYIFFFKSQQRMHVFEVLEKLKSLI